MTGRILELLCAPKSESFELLQLQSKRIRVLPKRVYFCQPGTAPTGNPRYTRITQGCTWFTQTRIFLNPCNQLYIWTLTNFSSAIHKSPKDTNDHRTHIVFHVLENLTGIRVSFGSRLELWKNRKRVRI